MPLLDLGRQLVEQRVQRPWLERLRRQLLLISLPYPKRFATLLGLAQGVRPLLPKAWQAKLPIRQAKQSWPPLRHRRRMLILQGCVQASLAPRINLAAANVLDRLGISLIPIENCCGALPYHLNEQKTGLAMMRAIIDACWPHVENGIEAIVSTASGCGVTVKDYASLLRHDPDYAAKALRVSALSKDLCEVIEDADLSALPVVAGKIAFHSPCTLQHGQQLSGRVEKLLSRKGFILTQVADAHLCCGSAGTYSILQPELAAGLQRAKLAALQADRPTLIATANIGCWAHLQEKAEVPVVHWIELLV